ncbi:LUD domain-containing protein [Spirosoma knui]
MTARNQLLDRIRQNKPEPLPLPEVPLFITETDDLLAQFQDALTFVGGQLIDLRAGGTLAEPLRQRFPEAQRIVSAVALPGIELTTIDAQTDKVILEQIDVAVLQGEFAVAENSAIWVPEAAMFHRALPFIAQHLVLVINPARLVPNMHVAYQQIDRTQLSYGVFIAGPSKTADIEQSLVIGAHGARSLTVVFMNDTLR